MQPRADFNDESLNALSESICRYGFIQPLTVKKRAPRSLTVNGQTVCSEKYELVSGERRYRAAKRLGLKTVPCIVVTADMKSSALIALTENLQFQQEPAGGGEVRRALQELPCQTPEPLPFASMGRRGEPQYLEETMDLTQGKLSMGFTTGITTRDAGFPALMVLNALFGGDLTSKLFLHVREKLSLCYYASSSVYGAKGILTVSSGIDTCNYQRTKEEILRQLAACQAGEITQEELKAAQEAICSSLRTIPDAPGRMEDFALFRLLSGFPLDRTGYRDAVRAVTVADAAWAARQVELDTIFFLKGAKV